MIESGISYEKSFAYTVNTCAAGSNDPRDAGAAAPACATFAESVFTASLPLPLPPHAHSATAAMAAPKRLAALIVPEGFGSTQEFARLMTRRPAWAEDLPIAANAWSAPRYTK